MYKKGVPVVTVETIEAFHSFVSTAGRILAKGVIPQKAIEDFVAHALQST